MAYNHRDSLRCIEGDSNIGRSRFVAPFQTTVAPFNNMHLHLHFRPPFASCLSSGPRSFGCAFSYKNRFYILGGDGLNGTLNDSFAYTEFPLDLTSGPPVWHTVTANQTFFLPPANRNTGVLAGYLEPCVVTPNGTLIVGGNDLIGYDIANDRWLGPLAGGAPTTPLFYPKDSWGSGFERVVRVEDSLWIFEDVVSATAVPAPLISVLNLTTFTWARKLQGSANRSFVPIPQPVGNTSLYYVSPSMWNFTTFGLILMLGGQGPNASSTATYCSSCNSNIWIFDLEYEVWITEPSLSLASPIDGAQAFFYPPTGLLYIFPGKATLHLMCVRNIKIRALVTIDIISIPLTLTQAKYF